MTPDINRVLNDLYLLRGEGVIDGLSTFNIQENIEVIIISDEISDANAGFTINEDIIITDSFHETSTSTNISEIITVVDTFSSSSLPSPDTSVTPQIFLHDEVIAHPNHSHDGLDRAAIAEILRTSIDENLTVIIGTREGETYFEIQAKPLADRIAQLEEKISVLAAQSGVNFNA